MASKIEVGIAELLGKQFADACYTISSIGDFLELSEDVEETEKIISKAQRKMADIGNTLKVWEATNEHDLIETFKETKNQVLLEYEKKLESEGKLNKDHGLIDTFYRPAMPAVK